MHSYGVDGWWFFGMHALWWLFWVALIGVALALFRSSVGPQRTGGTALERLQQRYANGEISTEEYEERRRTLERDRAK